MCTFCLAMSWTGPAAAICFGASIACDVCGAKPPNREESEEESALEEELLSALLRRLERVCRARRAAKPRIDAQAAAATATVAAGRDAAACAALHPAVAAAVAMVCVARSIVERRGAL